MGFSRHRVIWASVAAFLQIIAITSHRWFTATSFGAELRMGLRDTQLCTLVGCRSTGYGSSHSTLMLLVFLLGWACAGLLVAAAVAHKRKDDDRLWRFAGIAATLQLALMIVVYIDPQDLNLDRGSAFLLCFTSLICALAASFKNEWSDAEARILVPEEAIPSARLHSK